MLTNYDCCSQTQIVLLYRQLASTRIWLLMLLIDMISVNIPLITLYDASNHKELRFFKDELNSVLMREFVGLRPNVMLFFALAKWIKCNATTAHTVRTVHNRKVSLTVFDTKRWLREDTIHTHSHGQRILLSCPMLWSIV